MHPKYARTAREFTLVLSLAKRIVRSAKGTVQLSAIGRLYEMKLGVISARVTAAA